MYGKKAAYPLDGSEEAEQGGDGAPEYVICDVILGAVRLLVRRHPPYDLQTSAAACETIWALPQTDE